MTNEERAAILEAARDLGVRLGVDWRNLPGVAEIVAGDAGKARRERERRQEFAARYGVRADCVPDFGEDNE